MKRIKEAIHLLLALPVLCAALSGFARADGPDAVWAQLAETPDGVSAVLEANTPVSDGVIQVAFDPDKLTYASCDFAGQQGEYQSQVAMYAVNDAQAGEGVVRISWVAPQDLAPGHGAQALFQVNFQAKQDGAAPGDVTVSGSVYTPDGQPVPVGQQPAAPQPRHEPTQEPTQAPTPQPGQDSTQQPGQDSTQQPAVSAVPGQGQSLSTGGKEELPPTGDTAHVGVYLTLAAASAAALGAAAVWSRQRRGAK